MSPLQPRLPPWVQVLGSSRSDKSPTAAFTDDHTREVGIHLERQQGEGKGEEGVTQG
jgi:hypothetical protein